MKIMGIDPSLRCTGIAVVEILPGRMKPLHWDTFELLSAVDVPEAWIARQVWRRVEPWFDKVERVGIETPFLGFNPHVALRQAIMLGGITMLVPEDQLAKVVRVSPKQVKTVFGLKKDKEGKKHVVAAVESLLGTEGKNFLPLSKLAREAVCDAVGIAKAAYLLSGE
jgi:Holliday junction resolvasome RuvABC endonuclease subunit